MNVNLLYLKGHFARWLVNITLVISLATISLPVFPVSKEVQIAATELIHTRHKSIIPTAHYHEVVLPLSADSIQITNYLQFILFYNRLVKIESDYLAGKFIMIRLSIQHPRISFIFHHSGLEPVIA